MAGRRWWLILALVALPLLAGLPAAGAAAPPPGGRIAYQGADGKLHLIGSDGAGDRTLPTRGDALAPRWSPAGDALVYADELPGERPEGQLAVINPATGAARVLVPAALRDPSLGTYWSYRQPRWSPDGRAVYYLLVGGGRLTTIMRVPAAGGTPEEVAYGVNTTRFDISPTDGHLALVDDAFAEEKVQGSQLVLLDPDGGNGRTLLPRSGVYYYQPTWLPDGRSIAVRRQSAPNSATSTLIAVDPATGAQRELGTLPGGSTYSFAPDGSWLAYAAADAKQVTLVSLADFGDRRAIGGGVTPAWEPRAARSFPETGFGVGGRFLAYWEAHGGLAINGFPLSGEFEQVLEDGKTYRVQYFERVRLEYHPENPAPYDVLLGQFGRRILAGVPGAPTARAPQEAGTTYFAETGHNVGPSFGAYWRANGGLPTFGYPLTELFEQTLEDGRVYQVQYFERARFEYHPENADPYKVLLGQFGRRILAEAPR